MADNDFWQSIVCTAKNKTAEIADFVKNDINELSSEVHHYSDAVKRRAVNLLGNVKDSLNLSRSSLVRDGKSSVASFLKDLWSPETVHDDDSPMIIRDSEPVPMTDIQYRHHVLVSDPKNFTEGFTEGEQEQVDAWYVTTDENLEDVEYLGKQLADCPALAEMYRRLVPDQVTHSEFWKRYFFRRYLIFDCCPEGDVENYYTIRSERSPALEEIGLYDDSYQTDYADKISVKDDEPFAVEVESPYEVSNDWDTEFDIHHLKETDDTSLSDIISAN